MESENSNEKKKTIKNFIFKEKKFPPYIIKDGFYIIESKMNNTNIINKENEGYKR